MINGFKTSCDTGHRYAKRTFNFGLMMIVDDEDNSQLMADSVAAASTLVGDFQLMFVYYCIPLVGCGRPSRAESSTLSSDSSGTKKSVSQMYAKHIISHNS